MPLYEFQCNDCKETFTHLLKYEESKGINGSKCPFCKHGTMNRILSSGSFIIKGYSEKNGYSKKG